MKMLRMIGFVGFLSLTGLVLEPNVRGGAMQPPRFTLTDLGSVDGQANPYTRPTGYSMQGVYSSDPYKPGYRIGWTFTKDGSTTNLLPDKMANDVNIPGYHLTGYSSSGIVFGDDLNIGSSFYLNTNTNEYGNFKGSGIYQMGISSVNSTGQALGVKYTDFKGLSDWTTVTYYNSLQSDPIMLKDLITKDLGSWILYGAAGINDHGQIFGEMFNADTLEARYYRLDPVPVTVPEPSAFVVVALGVILCFGRHQIWKKRYF